MQFSMLKKRLKDYYGKYELELSGEIIIQNSDRTQLLTLGQSEHDLINQCLRSWSESFPFIKFEKKDSLAECRILLFAYKAPSAEKELLASLKKELELLLGNILGHGGMRVNLNVFGVFYNGSFRQHYRFLNKGNVVEYVITKEDKAGVLDMIQSNRAKRTAASVVILLLFLDMCCEALVLGHGWRLTSFEELWQYFNSEGAVNPKDVV